MPIFYQLRQENNPKSVNVGKWYAKAKCLGYWDLEKIADHIQENVSAKKSDVIAVLRELVVVMREAFDAGYGVKLDGFGRFKVGLKTKAAERAKEFTAAKHIVGSRRNLQAEGDWRAHRPPGCLRLQAHLGAAEAVELHAVAGIESLTHHHRQLAEHGDDVRLLRRHVLLDVVGQFLQVPVAQTLRPCVPLTHVHALRIVLLSELIKYWHNTKSFL